MPRARSNGIDLVYESHGDGEPLVLIAGFGCDRTIRSLVVPKLAAKFRVIVFDNREMGQSSGADSVVSIRQMADDPVGLLDALGLCCVQELWHMSRWVESYDAPAIRSKKCAFLLTQAHGCLTIVQLASGPTTACHFLQAGCRRSRSPTVENKGAYRDLGGITTGLKLALSLGVAVSFIAIWSSSMQLALLERSEFSVAEVDANDLREQIVNWAHLALYLLTVVLFGIWIVRAQKNVRALGAHGLRVSPGWAVGYFFIPIVCLWKPYQAMKDLWRASIAPANWRAAPVSFVLPLWWTLWIADNVFSNVAFRLGLSAKTLTQLRMATQADLLAEVGEILVCFAAISLVSGIATAQRERTYDHEWPAAADEFGEPPQEST